MACGYCSSTFDVATVEKYNKQFQQQAQQTPAQGEPAGQHAPSSALQPKEKPHVYLDEVTNEPMAKFTCNSCGGDVVGSPELVSSACPYCGNNFIAPSQLERTRVPDRMIPFQISPQQMVELFQAETKGLWFLPGDFRKAHKLLDARGVYLPYWLYDCSSEGYINCTATKTTSWRSGDYEYTRTDYYNVHRRGGADFEDVPVSGTKDVHPTRTEAIEPFDYSGTKPFATAYLAGYATNTYNIGHEEANGRANERIRQSMLELLEDTIHGYVTVQVDDSDVRFSKAVVEYVFLPVYLLNLAYHDRRFPFAINGQTGRVAGEFPVVFWKQALCFLLVTIILGAILFYPTLLVMGAVL